MRLYARETAERTANKNLIAASPELLEALQAVVAFWDSITMEDCVNDIHVKARAAIAKATGCGNDAEKVAEIAPYSVAPKP
jgi:hypothetical protein